MTRHDIIVIGGSTGGLEALRKVVAGLPADFPSAVFVVIHTPPDNPGALPDILGRSAALPVAHAKNDEAIRRGRIYVAPPDRHLLLKDGRTLLTAGPRENRFRPAVDPLFRSAAHAFGPRVVGIILSGGQNDGVSGLAQIKVRGGLAVVQRPDDAVATSMPLSAIRGVSIDHIVAAAEMPALLVKLAAAESREPAMATRNDSSPDVAEAGSNVLRSELTGPPSAFTCPDCGGALWEIKDDEVLRYRCHVGHGFTDEGLSDIQSDGVEHAMWYALRALEEHAALHRRLADRAREGTLDVIAASYEQRAIESEDRAAVIRQVLVGDSSENAEETADAVRDV